MPDGGAPARAPLALPDVTLACVDTRSPRVALDAMARCLAQVRVGDAVLLTDERALRASGAAVPDGVRIAPVEIPSVAAYSTFMVRGLGAHVRTSHVLVVQWDGFVLDAGAWDPRFLAYDYVGPRWPGWPPERAVGNGGFSLRSRALLDALDDPAIVPTHPEDVCICHTYRERLEQVHGIRFAPPEVADRFAYERTVPTGPTFGFHGLFNFPRALPADVVRAYVHDLEPSLLRGRDGRDLCKALIAGGLLDEAAVVLAKRRAAGLREDAASRRLALRLAWARLRAGRRSAVR